MCFIVAQLYKESLIYTLTKKLCFFSILKKCFFFCFFFKSECSLKECTLSILAENPLEGSAEVLVENGVDDGVEAAVAVADPEEECKDRLGQLARFGAHGLQAVGKEEREPADDEHSDHHRQDKGEAFLSVHHGFTACRVRSPVLLKLPRSQLCALSCRDHVSVLLDGSW